MKTLNPASQFRSALAAAALLGTVASSFAVLPAVAGNFEPPQYTVKYGDLNLSSPQGAAALYSRIRGAADNVCSTFRGRDFAAQAKMRSCLDKAILDAVTKVNAPALTSIYSAKAGKAVQVRLVSR